MAGYEWAEQVFYSFYPLANLVRPALELLPDNLYQALILGQSPFGS